MIVRYALTVRHAHLISISGTFYTFIGYSNKPKRHKPYHFWYSRLHIHIEWLWTHDNGKLVVVNSRGGGVGMALTKKSGQNASENLGDANFLDFIALLKY